MKAIVLVLLFVTLVHSEETIVDLSEGTATSPLPPILVNGTTSVPVSETSNSTRPWYWPTTPRYDRYRTTERPWSTTFYDRYRTTSRWFGTTGRDRYWTTNSWSSSRFRGSTDRPTRPDYVEVNGESQPTLNVDAYVKTFERRLRASMDKNGYKLIKSNGTSLVNYSIQRRGFKEISYEDTFIYGLERIEIEPSIGYIVDHNLIAVNGSIYLIHPFINTTINAVINSTNEGMEQKFRFKVSSFPDRKFKVYFSVLVSTRWDKMIIRSLSYDQYNPYGRNRYGYNRYDYYDYNSPQFDPILECDAGIENHEICSNLERIVKEDLFAKVPEKTLSLLRVIASGVKP